MNTKQKRTLQAFRRIQGWLAARPDIASTTQLNRPTLVTSRSATLVDSPATLGNVSADGVNKLVSAFNQSVELVTHNAMAEEMHDRAARSAASDIGRLRRELVDHHIRDIAVVAETAIPDVVRMTVELRRVRAKDAEGILAAADAMAKAVVPYRQALVQRGLPSDFIEQLSKASASYKSAIDSRGSSVAARHRAGQALAQSVQQGRRHVAALTVIVQRRYRDEKPLVAEWNQLKHVALVGARVAGEEDEASPATATAPAAPTVQQLAAQPRQQAA